jgi:hypothetical protein
MPKIHYDLFLDKFETILQAKGVKILLNDPMMYYNTAKLEMVHYLNYTTDLN